MKIDQVQAKCGSVTGNHNDMCHIYGHIYVQKICLELNFNLVVINKI